MQLRDHRLGRPRGREQPVPAEHVEAREARFGDSGEFGRERRALRGRYGQTPDSAGAYLGQAGRTDGEHYLQLPGDKIGDRRGDRFVRDVHHVDAGQGLEELRGEMRRRAAAA